jgi:hypothetical protein
LSCNCCSSKKQQFEVRSIISSSVKLRDRRSL